MRHVRGLILVLASLALARPLMGQVWIPPQCDLKTGHFKVNSGQLYMKSAYEHNNRDRDLKDAQKNLVEAITMNGQEKNGAAWYYLGRYYVAMTDFPGADSAFEKAGTFAPQCKSDILYWRRTLWTTPYNAGVAALNAGKTDSALASFKRANLVYRSSPESFIALGIIYFNMAQSLDSTARLQQLDSADKYFRAAVDASVDTQFASTKRSALFNLALVNQEAMHNAEAVATFQEYLRLDPNDAQAVASLATLYSRMGQKDSAQALYKRLLQRADSVDPISLFQAGVDIYSGAPPYPDTSAIGSACRQRERAKKPARPMTAAQRQAEVATTCNRETADSIKTHHEVAAPTYQTAADAFHAVLKRKPGFREALYNLTEVYFALDEADSMVAVSHRLITVDPMNRTSLRLYAQAWQLKAMAMHDSAAPPAQAAAKAYRDSAYKYVLSAQDSIPFEVVVDSFRPTEQAASISGRATNFHEQGSVGPDTLVFDFVGSSGDVIATTKLPLPAIPANTAQPFTAKAIGKGITTYRYHKQ